MKIFEQKSLKHASSLSLRSGVFANPGLLLLALFVAVPMLWVAFYSIAYSLGGIGLFSKGWTLQHWNAALADNSLIGAVSMSLTVAACVTLVAASISLATVLANPQLRHNPLLFAMLCLGMGTPSAVTALIVYQILSGGGLLARLCFHVGWIQSPTEFPQLVNDTWAIGIVVSLVIGSMPLLLLYFLQLWTTIKADRLCELAESLGASRWQARTKVALPMLLQQGKSMLLLVFLFTLGSYETPLLLGRQSPQMISVLTQRRSGIYDLMKRPEAFVLATTYFVITVTTLVIYLRWKRRHV